MFKFHNGFMYKNFYSPVTGAIISFYHKCLILNDFLVSYHYINLVADVLKCIKNNFEIK